MSTLKQDGSGLELTDTENTLRQLLLDVANSIDSLPPSSISDSQIALPEDLARSKLVLRFTGGWVRDKLLGVTSHDIDVAINKMTGYQFGLKMKEYLETPGNPEKYGLQGVASNAQSTNAGIGDKSKLVGGLHKIEANPEKSKHLETVTTKVLGLDIDLVNLRKETYSEESRNPQMEFGTPEEDALRRDATINALFYNLNLSKVEDFTGKGFSDMARKLIRTPLEPYQTFKDDPLRVLRLIRFASRLDYSIDPEVQKAMGEESIKEALRAKISRERVGIEIEKMLKGPRPFLALALIERLGLYSTIFTDPTPMHMIPDPEIDRLQPAYQVLESLLQPQKDIEPGIISVTVAQTADEKYIALLLAALMPWVDAHPPVVPKGTRKVPPSTAVSVAREGIKATNKICDIINAAVRNADEIIKLKDRLVQRKKYPHRRVEGDDPTVRDVLGMAIRSWGSSWRSQVLWAILAQASAEPNNQDRILNDYTLFLTEIKDLDLYEAYSLRPLIDGKTLAKALSTNPGPWMKSALDVVMAWQLRNPDKSDPEEAIEQVRLSREDQEQKQGELTKDLIHHFLGLTIRPLFAKTQHPTSITAQGRKRTTEVLPSKFEDLRLNEDESQTKPWKEQDSYALDLLEWALRSLPDGETIEKNWGLLVPPLLTVVDDLDHSMKARGCIMLKLLLDRTPPYLLARTGIGDVIEEAVMPCLSYLPTLTPEDESIALLSAAYPTLIALSKVRYLDNPPKPKTQRKPHGPTSGDRFRSTPKEKQFHFLDTLVRQGILSGFAHASDHVRVAETLFIYLIPLIDELGIEFVKHLKHVLPLITNVLSNPFGPAYPPLLIAAAKALQTLMLNCWPRMSFWRGEVLKGITLCWLRIAAENQSSRQLATVKEELRKTVQILAAAVKPEVDIGGELRHLEDADERLKGLFEGAFFDETPVEKQ